MRRIATVCAATLTALALAAPARAEADGQAPQSGQARFTAWCAACHQPTGLGVKGAFPPLAGSAVARGDPAALATLVLNGRGGMPSFGPDLSDADIAAILTYVRSAWGNSAGPISAAQVAAARTAPAPAAALQAH